jgi:hypothetical protein
MSDAGREASTDHELSEQLRALRVRWDELRGHL